MHMSVYGEHSAWFKRVEKSLCFRLQRVMKIEVHAEPGTPDSLFFKPVQQRIIYQHTLFQYFLHTILLTTLV